MEFWCFLALSALFIESSSTIQAPHYNAMENEAFIVLCPGRKTGFEIYWTYFNSNKSITTSEKNRIYSSGAKLKFLPTSMKDSGIYTCIKKSPTLSYSICVNITIYPQSCVIPNDLLYKVISGTFKKSMLHCPRIEYYDEITHVDWFKNCKALRGQHYFAKKDYLIIQNPTAADTGDYTCKFIYGENGFNFTVTASRSFIFQGESNYSMRPEITSPVNHHLIEVELGTNVNMSCKACLGKGSQMIDQVGWCIKEKNSINCIKNSRYHEENKKIKSSNNLHCRDVTLRIANLRKEDLSLEFYCWALNEHGAKEHSVRIGIKKTIGQRSTYYILAGFSTLLLLIIILTVILKVLWIDLILLWREIARPYKFRNDGKLYDAYVIYPRNYKNRTESVNSMEYFVHQILPEVLEKKCGYSLCIYGRDLLPGEDAASEMVKSIQKSRRQIIILNPQVEHGEEFAYEQEIALHCALMQNDSKVILIEMETTDDTRELPDSLKHIIKKQGTIEWKGDHVTKKRSLNSNFWKRVQYLMPAKSKSLDPLHSSI
ncbi:interleukin-1 receptor-like 1 isoform X1 [Vombatus ursinus]|uniref:Interleukin 1 receptor like 1 n=1 Tax=Vombatus ursinus TaxID=29139 RepID=A0A4X2K726_VOMUR|nr:interleukin-1 receptor-like 1 isoform X1 [Vombatus ursinus]XP_027722265.1 interleukin-1 receptor-like 1 isoform X1 [Vombatus ursinus]XP_027722294.1 interleukin-1 receptor-like 1 isoform X1 [Vombatus ursinus]XP_027722295.1 interleukin-1 receptor-like 1 isoform X1 [Vombatus ursinus]